MRVLISGMAGLAAMAALPVSAQAPEPSVAEYLCTFAGKCGDADEAAVTRDAPATKGFRVARASTAQQSAPPPAGPTKVIGTGRPNTATPRPTRYTATRPAPTPGAARGKPRADLMITFQLGSAAMTGDGIAKARIFASALRMPEMSGKRFMIEGHTDSLGAADANRLLSQRRAATVADFLASQGIGRDRIEVKGFGADQPLTGHRANDPLNRRVEAELIS